MRLAPSICWLTTVAALVLAGQAAKAQDYYNPPPTMSPWFSLFNKNPGPLGNYQSYVRPQLQLQNAFQQQGNSILQQGTGIQQGNARLDLLLDRLQQEGALPPTGHAAAFMNYSHYYGYQGTGAGAGIGMGLPQRTLPNRGTSGSMPFGGTPGMTSMPGMRGMPGGIQ